MRDKPDISQFKWVHFQVNYMKGNMTIQEWMDLMNKIISSMEAKHG